VTLHVDWCKRDAAAYACKNWHYSKTVPVARSVYLGVWEQQTFIGAVIFSWGANHRIGLPFGLTQTEVCELVRVALRKHTAPVSRIVALALKFLHKQSPKIVLVVSYADPAEGHIGGIYQAGNWAYLGKTSESFEYRIGAQRLHKRTFTGENFGSPRRQLPSNAKRVRTEGKHKYVYALDKAWREKLAALAQPYPKRVGSADSGTGGDQPSGDGASPISTLQFTDDSPRAG
jgi:hypothetical protein